MQLLLGIALIIAGAFILAYNGYTFKKGNKSAEVGDVKLTATTKKDIYLSPLVGGIIIAVGVLLLIF